MSVSEAPALPDSSKRLTKVDIGEVERITHNGAVVWPREAPPISEEEALMENYKEYQKSLPPWARGPV